MGDENILPLLKKEYYENCPGCKVDQLKEMQRGLPIKQLLFMWMVVLGTALSISSLFPFLYFMIRDFHIAEKEEDIGYYAGFVGSSYQLGRACTSILWGVLADKYGRKPVIIIGTAAVVIFNTLFGLSLNFWMAIVTRFLLGCFNGLLGPIKAYACEIFREEHQALGLSTVSTAWGIGLIIGPALGGFLAQPADKYPSVFSKYSVFGKFPYFLPCLTISTFALIVTISCFFIPETLHKHAKRETCEEIGTNMKGKTEEVDGNGPRKSLLKNWPLMSSIAVYCIFSLHDMAYMEIFSLWAESPKKIGGLSYTTDMVGEVLSLTGFALLVSQLSLYSKLERAFGAIATARVAGVLSIPLLTIYPFMTHLSGLSLSISLNIVSALKNVLSISIITGMYILQNKAVEQNQRGAANGIAMTLMSTCKAIGPAGGGAVFSWAQKRHNTTFLPGNHMVFFVLNIIEAVGVFATLKPFLVERLQ